MQDKYITLAHGNGGRFMRSLIEDIFARHLQNDTLDIQGDATRLREMGEMEGDVLFSVDGFTVQPLEFPGGNIGSLAVHGTVNVLKNWLKALPQPQLKPVLKSQPAIPRLYPTARAVACISQPPVSG